MFHQNNTTPFNSQQSQTFLNTMMSSEGTSLESDMGRNIIDNNESTQNEITETTSPSGDTQQNKKARNNRHTPQQIELLERLFKACPHPDEKQRKDLGLLLGLEPLQIKFWFQNKRTHVKSQQERYENDLLRAENERLRMDNARLRAALIDSSCPNCGGPKLPQIEMSLNEHHQLRAENILLTQEMSANGENYGVNPGNSNYNIPSSENNMASMSLDTGVGNTLTAQQEVNCQIYGGADEPLVTELPNPLSSICDKSVIAELAVQAMNELTRLALSGEPLWIPGKYGMEILNQDEYVRNFPRGAVSNDVGFEPESSRQSAVIIMNPIKLVEMLMDVNQWSKIFCGIVIRARTSQVLPTTGAAGDYNGAQHVIHAEFQVLSPFVPTRIIQFVRYCKKLSAESWAIVDFSLDDVMLAASKEKIRARRRPSGCIIQELPAGYSKVIWVEHVEVDNSDVRDDYKILVKSSHGFGAKRWVATLDRQCERLASSMATNIPASELCGVITTYERRSTLLKLGERMILSFLTVAGAAIVHPWTPITNCSNVRIMSRNSLDDPGRPSGILLCASTSLWLPVPVKKVFDYLSCEATRNQWDFLSNAGSVQKLAHIANGRDSGNCVSLLSVSNSVKGDMIILQESRTDVTGSYLVYAPFDIATMNTVLNGGCHPDYVALLPSGFAILPDGPTQRNPGPIVEIGSGGCLLTAAFQILVDSGPSPKLSILLVNIVDTLTTSTVNKIKAAIMCDTSP